MTVGITYHRLGCKFLGVGIRRRSPSEVDSCLGSRSSVRIFFSTELAIGFISGVAGSRILGAWRLGDLEFLDYGLGLNQ